MADVSAVRTWAARVIGATISGDYPETMAVAKPVLKLARRLGDLELEAVVKSFCAVTRDPLLADTHDQENIRRLATWVGGDASGLID